MCYTYYLIADCENTPLTHKYPQRFNSTQNKKQHNVNCNCGINQVFSLKLKNSLWLWILFVQLLVILCCYHYTSFVLKNCVYS